MSPHLPLSYIEYTRFNNLKYFSSFKLTSIFLPQHGHRFGNLYFLDHGRVAGLLRETCTSPCSAESSTNSKQKKVVKNDVRPSVICSLRPADFPCSQKGHRNDVRRTSFTHLLHFRVLFWETELFGEGSPTVAHQATLNSRVRSQPVAMLRWAGDRGRWAGSSPAHGRVAGWPGRAEPCPCHRRPSALLTGVVSRRSRGPWSG